MTKLEWLRLAKRDIEAVELKMAIKYINEVIALLENEDKERMNDE